MDKSTQKLGKRLSFHSSLLLNVMLVWLYITSLVMIIVMAFGIYKIGKGIALELHLLEMDAFSEEPGIVLVLKGLEYIFISPLFYLLVLSLTKYFSATKPEISDTPLPVKREYMKHAMIELMNVKVLTVSLFISVITLHLLSAIIINHLETSQFFFSIGLVALLVIYYYVIDVLAERMNKH